MTRLRNHPVLVVLTVMLLLAAAACSSSGGKKAEENTATAAAGKATTPRITIAMVTHGAPGDTFWDIIRKGAQAAAAKDNVTFKYSADPDSGNQANLIQSAIDSKVDGIAVTLPDPPAIAPAVKKAIAAGIPVVAFNAGIGAYQQSGALSYFGSDESLAGQTGGKRASADGFKHVLCVIQEQGQVQLEARCDGVKSTFSGTWTKLYVNGRDQPSARRSRSPPSTRSRTPAARPSSGRSTSTPRFRPRSSPVTSSGRSTSSRSCRATSPSTRCGCTRRTATSSAVGRRP